MSVMHVAIVDYGIGNLFNIRRAFEYLNLAATIESDPKKLCSYSHLVLPGVGAFGAAVSKLDKTAFRASIIEFAASSKPILGVCLGLQLLFDSSEETAGVKGLGLIEGNVIGLKKPERSADTFKIPHFGWSNVDRPERNNWTSGIFKGISSGEVFYFVHSFCVCPDDVTVVAGETSYGYDRFCAAVSHNNIYGTQFHPEMSGETGLKLLHNFVNET